MPVSVSQDANGIINGTISFLQEAYQNEVQHDLFHCVIAFALDPRDIDDVFNDIIVFLRSIRSK